MNVATWKTIASMLALVAFADSANAEVIAFTSFENEVSDADGLVAYTDTGDAGIDHDLVNNVGQVLVDSTPGSFAAGDLGFNARFETTGNEGLSGDLVGVVSNSVSTVPHTDGEQGYRMGNTDGVLVVEFDPVPINGPTFFEMDYLLRDTGWEGDEAFSIFLTIDGSSVVTLLNTTGTDIDDLIGVEGVWTTAAADLTGLGSAAVLTVTGLSQSSTESMNIDRVTFTAVPEPTSLALIGLSAFAFLAARRRSA